MNDIVRQNIKEKLEAAIIKEKITNVSAGFKLGINGNYISMIKNPKTWFQCPISAWETVLKWVNSGQGIVEYAEKHGKVVPKTAKPVLKTENSAPRETIIVPESITPDVRIKIKPGVLEKRQKEIEHKRMSNGQLIDLLMEEKELLRQKIEAIDVLLKHYIS